MKPTKIAFVSCAYATMRPEQPAWKAIREAAPDLLLLLGDNAYMNWRGSTWDFDALEHCYREQFKIPEFLALTQSVPTLAIWDDHDCGPDDTLGAQAPPAALAATREKFDRWMKFARNNNRPHMYCTYDDLPDVRVIMLDVRSYRTASDGAAPTMLGEAQEQWLWSQLDPKLTPQRKFTIIASGTGFSVGAAGHRIQSYTSFANKLRKRLAFKAGNGATDPGRRALLLAGDVHYTTFKTHGKRPFHEAISSGVACFRARTDDFSPQSHADNWGLISIGDDVRVEFHGNELTTDIQRPATISLDNWQAKIG